MSLRLKKAVWSSTLPSGPPDNEAARTVQEYLRDPNTVNAVYLLLVDRAQGVPRNWNIVNKALQQLKTHIQKYVPSSDTLSTVLDLCRSLEGEVAQAGPQAAAIRTLIDYLKKKLRSTGLVDSGGSIGTHSVSASMQQSRMEDIVRQSLEPPAMNDIRKSGPLQPSAEDQRQFSGLGAGPSGQGAVPIDLFQQRWALDGPPPSLSLPSLLDLSSEAARSNLALLLDPLTGARDPRTPKDGGGNFGRGPGTSYLQHEERPDMREQMEAITRHLQESAGCLPDHVPAQGVRPRVGMFVPTVYNQQELLQMDDEEVVIVLAAVLGPSCATDGDQVFEGVDLNQVATPAEVESHFMPLLIKMIMDFYVTATYKMSYEMVSQLLRRAVSPIDIFDPRATLYQERVFDLITNIVVHGELLEREETKKRPGSAPAPAPAPAPLDGDGDEGDDGDGPPPSPLPETPLQTPGFFYWLRTLLFDALEGLVEYQSRLHSYFHYLLNHPNASRDDIKSFNYLRNCSWNSRVWQSALGAMCMVSSRCGALDATVLDRLPLKVMNGFLEASKRCGWSEVLHTRLVLLSLALLYSRKGLDPNTFVGDEGERLASESESESETESESEADEPEEDFEASTESESDPDSDERRRHRRKRGRGAYPATVWGHVSVDEIWLDNWKLRDFGGIYRVMRLYCDTNSETLKEGLFSVVLDYCLQKAWDAIQRRHGGVANAYGGVANPMFRDLTPPKELAKRLATHLVALRAPSLMHWAVVLCRHTIIRPLLLDPLLREWVDPSRKVEVYLAGGEAQGMVGDRSIEREFIVEVLKLLDDCVSTRPECQPPAGFEDIRKIFDLFHAETDLTKKLEQGRFITRWFEAEWGAREAESAMFWLLVQVVDAAAWGRDSDSPSGAPRLTDMVMKRWPIAPCFLLRMWTEAPYHEFVRVVQRLALHIAARNSGLPGVLPLSAEDEKMIGRVPLKCSSYQGDTGVVQLVGDALSVLLSMVPRKPRSPLTDWSKVRILGQGTDEPLATQLIGAIADLSRFLLNLIMEPRGGKGGSGGIGWLGGSGGGADNDAEVLSSSTGGSAEPGPLNPTTSSSGAGLPPLPTPSTLSGMRMNSRNHGTGAQLNGASGGLHGLASVPEGALWLGESFVHRDVVKALPLEVLARTVDVLLDYSQTYPMGPNLALDEAPASSPGSTGSSRRGETLRASVLEHTRLVRLGISACPRELLQQQTAHGQLWTSSLEDLGVSMLQLIVWKCQLGPDPSEVAAMGGVALFTGLLKSRSPAACHLASKFLQHSMTTKTRELYLKALKQVSRLAQKKGNEVVLSNPYLQVKSLLESTDADPAVRELVANLEI